MRHGELDFYLQSRFGEKTNSSRKPGTLVPTFSDEIVFPRRWFGEKHRKIILRKVESVDSHMFFRKSVCEYGTSSIKK